MSPPALELSQLLRRLARPHAVLARARDGRRWAIYPHGDRRRRALMHGSPHVVAALIEGGALKPGPLKDTYVLGEAGYARARRDGAEEDAFLAQHAAIGARSVIEPDGALRSVRAVRSDGPVPMLARLKDGEGRAFFDAGELAAAARLRALWETGQAGLSRGSDWQAPPRGAGARGPGNGLERAMEAGCDARRRVEAALDALSPALRRVVERVCFAEIGLEALERAEGWPARSAKIALKLGLSQLAQRPI